MILSKTGIYALQATLCLAEAGDRKTIPVADVAARLDVPRNYLSKILHVLARDGALASTRGPGGGFRLAARADEITLSSIVRHFDEFPDASGCLLGRARCSDSDPCAAHQRWKDVASAVATFFDDTTLADLASDQKMRASQVTTEE